MDQRTTLWIKRIGYAWLCFFLLLSAWYAKERVIYIDSANQLFGMINKEGFEVFVGRYSMIFSQLLPLAAIKLHFPLRVVVLLYSLSFGLIFLFIYYLCVEKLKNLAAGWVICITYVSAAHTFFHALSETAQLIAYSSLLFAWLAWLRSAGKLEKPGIVNLLITLFLLLLNFFIHPVALFTVLFVIMYLFFDEIRQLDKKILFLAAAWVIFFVVKALFFSKGSHDSSFFGELKNTPAVLGSLGDIYPVIFLRVHFWQFYFIPLLMWVLVSANWLRNRQYLKAGLLNAFFWGFLLLTLIIYNKGDADHGMERSFLPFLFFSALAFIQEILAPLAQRPRLGFAAALLSLALIFISGRHIIRAAPVFAGRTELLQNWIDKVACRESTKFYIQKGDYDEERLLVSYGTSVETMMLSSLDNPDKTKTIFLDKNHLDTLPGRFNQDEIYFTPYWLLRSQNELNPDYFRVYGQYDRFIPSGGPPKTIYFDFERLSENGFFFMDKNGYMAEGVSYRDTLESVSGPYAVKLGKPVEFAMKFSFPVEPYQEIEVRVKRKGSEKAMLVITDDHDLYRNQGGGKPHENGWIQMSEKVSIPQGVHSRDFKIYFWNPEPAPAWFDDLEILIKDP